MKQKVLLFTHGSDIDGMGSVILSKLAFHQVDYYFCETSTIDQIIKDNIRPDNAKNYDYIFVTDLCPSNDVIEMIHERDDLKSKFVIFDHHQTNLNRVPAYDFVNIFVSFNRKKSCATSLFYDYLLKNHFLEKKTSITRYVRYTQLEDTWEWKKNNCEAAHDLTHLFNYMGRDSYIDYVVSKLKNGNSFRLNKHDRNIILFMKNRIEKQIQSCLKEYREISINGLKGVLVLIDYQYRNEFPEYLRVNHYPIDFAMMICLNHHSVSIRSVSDCNVREIAEMFGGGGHDRAATFRIDEIVDQIYDIVLSKRD